MEFNPTLGYIQGNDQFEIWVKFKPDRTILTQASKYITYEEGEHHSVPIIDIPVKVVAAN